MKKYLLILSAIACTKLAFAQSISVTEETTTFSTGTQNALVATIHKNSKDAVASKWKDYLKDFKNEKVKMENNEVFGDNVLIKEWGNNPVDIYARFEENKADNTVKLMVAFNL